jgi:hypothetical protein
MRSSGPLRAAGVALALTTSAAQAQEHQHEHMNMDGAAWTLMQDAVVFAEFNHQGGPRGGDEFVVPNWWMGMASRSAGRGRLTLTSMLSLDAATVGVQGYRELFQAGEAFDGQPIVDRQHPHDFFMQLAAAWRVPLVSTTVTIAGGPVAEPALGPIAFMHRASAADNPTAPLGHHTFDSTHIAFGVVTGGIDRGRWTVEGSLFNGREPDQHRWNIEVAPLDSYSGRVWFRPSREWALQVSAGHLSDPEELEPGDIIRTTASASWTRLAGDDLSGVTVGYGRNDTDHGSRNAFFAEAARHAGPNGFYGRFESVQLENDATHDPVAALTVGGVRDLLSGRRFQGSVGADVTFYGVPDALAQSYSPHPVSFHVFLRIRPIGGTSHRMWNMRLGG